MAAAAPGTHLRRIAARGEEGYTLAVLIMLATVMSILVTAALPAWSKMIQRDKEEELIARGWQYAEAVRVFQNRFGRLPVSLDELIKVKPRCIRHLYKDPITGEAFAPIFLNNPVTPPPPGPTRQPPPANDDKSKSKKNVRGSGDDDSGGGFDPGKVKVSPVGPVIGVHSTSDKESSLLFYGRGHYNEWQFTVMMLTHRGVITSPGGGSGVPIGGGGSGAGGGRLETSVRWLGRPPFNLVPGMPVPPPGPRGGPPSPPSPHIKQKP